MIRAIVAALMAVVMCAETPNDWALDNAWHSMNEQQKYEAPLELKARAAGMTEEEFDLISRVVEAESDRSPDLEGRVLIALVLFNRVESGDFPGDITSVCTQSGQFQVVYEGTIWSVGRTNMSDWAILEAQRRIEAGLAPNVMYFNNSGYAYGEPYDYVGGNYFVTVPEDG